MDSEAAGENVTTNGQHHRSKGRLKKGGIDWLQKQEIRWIDRVDRRGD